MGWGRFLRRRRWDMERAREIESYLEIETADNIARGMTPAEASRAARRRFGNPALVREEIYRMNTVEWIESFFQDVRRAGRSLLASPGFACASILSLTLGIGANVAIFQLLNAVRLRSLPVRNPGELAEIRIVGGNGGMGLNSQYGELTRPIWEEIRRDHPAFAGVFAWGKDQFSTGEGSSFQLAAGIRVSGEFFSVLGVTPWRGRLLNGGDELACPARAAVVSYDWWKSRMGEKEIGSGARLLINGELKQVVGVTAPSFFGLAVGDRFDIAVPFCRPKELARNGFDLTVMGRLRPGWTVSRAAAQLAVASPAIMAATEIRGYDADMVRTYRNFRLGAWPASAGVSDLRKTYNSSLWLLMGITGLVLLIACANVANLMLARASIRGREISVRLALGAGRLRVVRQTAVESGLLAVVGAVLGIFVAGLLSRVLVDSLGTADDPVSLGVGLDWPALLFAIAVAGFTCVAAGVAPALRASGMDPVSALKAGGRGMSGGRERFSMQRALVIAQISVSLLLITGALLFVRSFRNLMTFDPGIREEGVAMGFVGFEKSGVGRDRIWIYGRGLLDEVRAIPGITSAASTTLIPLAGGSWSLEVTVGAVAGSSRFTWVSPGYFGTMGIPVLRGRDIALADTGSSRRTALVNETFVRRFMHGTDPLGQTLRTHGEPGYPPAVYQIVGVVADTRYSSLRDEIPPMAFAPDAQFPDARPAISLVIRSSGPPDAVIASLKRHFASKHPEMITEFRIYQAEIRDRLTRERMMAMLSGFFGVLAALLGTIGLYGVVSYMTARRNTEIGIRMALGASRGRVIGLVMGGAGTMLLIGVAIGTVLSLVAGRVAGSLLFGLKANDPATLTAGAALLAVIGAAASVVPAWRASKRQPMDALRSE